MSQWSGSGSDEHEQEHEPTTLQETLSAPFRHLQSRMTQMFEDATGPPAAAAPVAAAETTDTAAENAVTGEREAVGGDGTLHTRWRTASDSADSSRADAA